MQARDLDEVQWFYNNLDGWGWIVSSSYSDANMIHKKELDEQQWFAKQSLIVFYLLIRRHSVRRKHDPQEGSWWITKVGESFNGLVKQVM